MTSSDFVCESCGQTFPVGDLRIWRQEELVQAPPATAIASRGALAPVTRNAYATRAYRLCPTCFTDVSDPIEQDLEYQRRGVLVVAVIGLIAFLAVAIAAALHSDLFRSPHDQHKGALGAMPIPYKNPLPTIPTAGN